MAKVGIEFSHYSLSGRRVMRWILRPEVIMVKSEAVIAVGGQFKVTDTSKTEAAISCIYKGETIAYGSASVSDREIVAVVDTVVKKAYSVIFDKA